VCNNHATRQYGTVHVLNDAAQLALLMT